MNPLVATVLAELTERDLLILDDLEQFRLLTTKQIRRLYFPVSTTAHANAAAASKATMRVLERLERHRLVSRLGRRIGGVRSGSTGYIWQLTSAGDRLQRARRGKQGRKRYVEPGLQFIGHTLAVTDAMIELRSLAQEDVIELLHLDGEPACWRQFLGPHGTPRILKPDLYAVTAAGAYEDSWFIEIDQATEHIPAILRKCQIYAAYAATGTEQHQRGVFPATLWVVPNAERARKITDAIAGDRSLPDGLFQVITAENFTAHFTPPVDDNGQESSTTE